MSDPDQVPLVHYTVLNGGWPGGSRGDSLLATFPSTEPSEICLAEVVYHPGQEHPRAGAGYLLVLEKEATSESTKWQGTRRRPQAASAGQPAEALGEMEKAISHNPQDPARYSFRVRLSLGGASPESEWSLAARPRPYPPLIWRFT